MRPLQQDASAKRPPEQTIVDTVEHVARMGLANIRDSIIGDEQVRGISGGQRKRVNIALELITEPSLLFLDEPTSGLDGTSTLEILQILRSLANAGAGKTIILTIHQPRIEAYKLVDNLILLVNGGRLVYYGPAYPDAPEYFSGFTPEKPYQHPANPADYVIDLLDSSIQSDSSFKVDRVNDLGSLVTSDALFGIDCRLEKRFKPLMMSWNRLSNDIGLVNIRLWFGDITGDD